jgi:hypothetical protein
MRFTKYGQLFRTVNIEDAEFIFELRTNQALGKYLSKTNGTVLDQQNWINEYKKREEAKQEFYFLSYSENGEKYGLNRVYEITENKFEIGSWLYKTGLEERIPILGDLAIRDFGFDFLSADTKFCTFNVNKQNKKVLRYHKLFNPTLVKEDAENFYFELSLEKYNSQKQKLINILL